jgi:hypothetical protein
VISNRCGTRPRRSHKKAHKRLCGTLRTVADAAKYIVALSEDRRRTHWDRTAQLPLDLADSSEISRQLELALFYDRQLNLKTPPR